MLTRLGRIVRHRLPLLVAVVAIGTVGAVLLTNANNAGIHPTFQAVAVASLPVDQTETGTGRSAGVQTNVAEAQAAGVAANAEFIDANHVVNADAQSQGIEFIVTAGTPEEATTGAADMRDRYLVATAPAPVEARMEEVLTKAHVVREQLNALLPPEELIPSDPLVAAQKSLLSGQISSLTSESAQLSVDLVLADTETEKAAIQADIDTILAQIVALRTQLQALPPDATAGSGGRLTPDDTTSSNGRENDPVLVDTNEAVDDQFQIDSLQSLYSSLQAEFQMLYIESTSGDPAQLPEISVSDETPNPIPLALAGATGLLGFLLLGMSVVLVDDRLRPKWWTHRDLKGVLAETPDRRVSGFEPWYWNTPGSQRKLAIQKVAVNFLPSVESGPVAVGVVGLATNPTALRAFSVDLAATMVTTGRSSLVIDTTGLEEGIESEPWQLIGGGPVVADLLNPWKLDIDDSQISKAVDEAGELWPGLSVIPSGGPSLYSIEGAMTPVAGKLLDHARKTFDLTLVPITERGTALSDALVRNLDAVVIVGRGGKTSIRDAEKLAERLTANGSNVLGSVLVVRPTRRKFSELLRWLKTRKDQSPQQAMDAPVVTPRARFAWRYDSFEQYDISEDSDIYSISESWKPDQVDLTSDEAVEAIAVNENGRERMSDPSSNDGNGRRPSLTAILASHPDARPRSDG